MLLVATYQFNASTAGIADKEKQKGVLQKLEVCCINFI